MDRTLLEQLRDLTQGKHWAQLLKSVRAAPDSHLELIDYIFIKTEEFGYLDQVDRLVRRVVLGELKSRKVK